MPLVSLVSMTSMVWSPSRSLMVLVVDASLPPRKSQLSQLPAMVSQSSLYRLFPWETVCRMIEQLMPRERMVATSLTKFGILPMLANSSSRQCTSRPSRPPSAWSAFLTRVSKRHW